MAWTAPRTWVADEVVTAATMNTHVRDNLKAIGDAWTSYTPTVTQSGTVTSVTISSAKYVAAGKLIICQVAISFTGGTGATGNNPLLVSLPVSALSSSGIVGTGQFYDATAGAYNAVVWLNSTTSVYLSRTDALPTDKIGKDPNMTVANGDYVGFAITYEAA